MENKEKINFIYNLTNEDAIADSASWMLNLETIKRDYGYNYNSIVVCNLHTADFVFVRFDGISTRQIPVAKNGGFLTLSQEDMIKYSQVEIVNSSGSEIAIGKVNVSVIRAGAQ